MNKQNFGEIAALEYHLPPEMDFPDIVEEFDIASHALATQVRRLTWDGDDVAIIDRESVRIALGWLPPERAQSGSAALPPASSPSDSSSLSDSL